MRVAQASYRWRTDTHQQMTMPGLLGPAFRERLTATMRVPVVEALFAEPWTAAARRVLPSPSPHIPATAMWGPIIAWCAVETLAESINMEAPEPTALDLFDQLRLRKPLAEAFNALGFDGEAGWRAAARFKVVLLAEAALRRPETESTQAAEGSQQIAIEGTTNNQPRLSTTPQTEEKGPNVSKPTLFAGLPQQLWSDPDVRWLTGLHDAESGTYFVREPFEELLWWLQMPKLIRIAGQSTLGKAEFQQIRDSVRESIAEAEKAGYRLQNVMNGGADRAPKNASAANGRTESAAATTAEDAETISLAKED
jgi:hypothetical protein